MLWRCRVKGTINDEIEVEADTEEEALDRAAFEWRYVEFEDLWVEDAKEVGQ